MMSLAEMESKLLQQARQIQLLQEQIAALSPRTGMDEGMYRPIKDHEHVGYWDDLFEHGTKAIGEHQVSKLCHKAQRAYHMDPSGRVGKDWKHVVQASTGEWLAVDGWLP